MPLSPNEIKEKLLGALDSEYNILNETVVLDVVGLLEHFPITKEDLELTRIGKHVNELRRKTTNQDLCRRAKSLVRSWQKLVLQQHDGSITASRVSPAVASPAVGYRAGGKLPPPPSPRTSSPLVSGHHVSGQPPSPAFPVRIGPAISPAVSSPLARASASPVPPFNRIASPAPGRAGIPTVPAVAVLRATGRIASPASPLVDRTSSAVTRGGAYVASPSLTRQASSPRLPVNAIASPAQRLSSAVPGAGLPSSASPRSLTQGLSRGLAQPVASSNATAMSSKVVSASSLAKVATSPAVSSRLVAAPLTPSALKSSEKPSNHGSASMHELVVTRSTQQPKSVESAAANRNGANVDERLHSAYHHHSPAVGTASSPPSWANSTTSTPLKYEQQRTGSSHSMTPVHDTRMDIRERTNGDVTAERSMVSKTNAANKKRRRSDDSVGGSSTSSAPPKKIFNGDPGTPASSHTPSMRNLLPERRPPKVKTTAQLIADLQASKGGDDLLKSDTITKIVANQIEREKYFEHESVVPASAKPRPRKKPLVSSSGKLPDAPDGISLAEAKSQMVQKYLSTSMLVGTAGSGDDSQMTFASSSPSTVGGPSFSIHENAADQDDEEEFIDIMGLDGNTPESLPPAPVQSGPLTQAATAAGKNGQRLTASDDPYSLLPPLNLNEIVWSDDEDLPCRSGESIAINDNEVTVVDKLHEGKWPGVNGVRDDGSGTWHDWTETMAIGRETSSTLFILPYVDVGD